MHDYNEIIGRYEDELLNRVTPFWAERAVDRENGGFFNSLDREGNCFDTAKSIAMQWRNVYMFAALYNSEYSKDEYLELAGSASISAGGRAVPTTAAIRP